MRVSWAIHKLNEAESVDESKELVCISTERIVDVEIEITNQEQLCF